MGNKYKLCKNIIPLFPSNINTFFDLFGGSGVISINMTNKAKRVVYNDFNNNVVELLNMFKNNDPDDLNAYFEEMKNKYGLRTYSVKSSVRIRDKALAYKDIEPGYLKLRDNYNNSEIKDYRDLYLLSCYSINHLMRFNSNNQFNVSCGADSYSPKIYEIIKNAHVQLNNICTYNKSAFDFIDDIKSGDFVYLDPPYTNTQAVYNEQRAYGGWSIEDDIKLFNFIDYLNSKNIYFGLSNVFKNRGIENTHLIEWVQKNNWYCYHFDKTYNPFSTDNSHSDEVYITNFKNETVERYESISLF